MNPTRRAALTAGLGLTALSTGGCISLLPKTKPAQMYRFGFSGGGGEAPAGGEPFGVMKPPCLFQREASNDRILTVEGSQVAYIGEARWVAPAQVLFDEAVSQAFARLGGPARLIGRGEARRADYTLRLDVREFEARYDHGMKAPPTITVAFDAVMTPVDRSAPRQIAFDSHVTAADNRVGAIVDAFNAALAETLPKLVAWVGEAGPVKD